IEQTYRRHEEFSMIFMMNEAATAVETRGRTVGDILAELDEHAETMGDIIVEVRLDGVALSPDQLAEISGQDASGSSTVELVSEPAAAMKSRALETLLELVSAAAAFAAADSASAADASALGAAMDAWRSFSEAFSGLFSAEELSFIDAYGATLSAAAAADSPAGARESTRSLADKLVAFFGERLAELQEPRAAMLSAARIFDAIKDDLSEVPVRLQTGKDAEAMRTMVLAVELVNKMVRIMPVLTRTASAVPLEIGGTPVAEFYGSFNDVLRELATAFENKDSVLIGDLAEYEIRPRLQSFFDAVRLSMATP
ncbi:MAG: hypothetical protein JXM71_04750, partial [Spirochaetales bacterium]|nr:hypothetical protein [Spirochaetales bacterium]